MCGYRVIAYRRRHGCGAVVVNQSRSFVRPPLFARSHNRRRRHWRVAPGANTDVTKRGAALPGYKRKRPAAPSDPGAPLVDPSGL